jgi:hypothetical protein
MTDAAPLQAPADSVLTLTAPAPVAPVAATSATAMAPKVDPAALPGLDAKVDKYLDTLPTGPSGWEELGGAKIQSQLNDLSIFHTDGSGGVGTIGYRWLCVSDKSTPNGDGSYTRVVQFMRVNQIENKLYSRGNAQDGGLA